MWVLKGNFYVSETVNIPFNGGIQILKSKSVSVLRFTELRQNDHLNI